MNPGCITPTSFQFQPNSPGQTYSRCVYWKNQVCTNFATFSHIPNKMTEISTFPPQTLKGFKMNRESRNVHLMDYPTVGFDLKAQGQKALSWLMHKNSFSLKDRDVTLYFAIKILKKQRQIELSWESISIDDNLNFTCHISPFCTWASQRKSGPVNASSKLLKYPVIC